MRILVIEDDLAMADHLSKGIQYAGHSVDFALDGTDGLRRAVAGNFDVLVIDRMLPGIDGLSIVRALRDAGQHTPVLLLTTMSGLDDRVQGLEAGADDYLAKPFAMAELLARLNALGRRTSSSSVKTVLRRGPIEMDLLKRVVHREGKLIDLHPQEFKLLEYFLRSEGRMVTKSMLLEHVWGFHFDPQTTVVETHVSRLRTKLDRDFDKPSITTKRGEGYRFAH